MVMNIEQQMMERVSRDIAESIDWQIISDIFTAGGWTTVMMDKDFCETSVTEWLDVTCKNRWRRYKNHFMFKNNKDATWFVIRWS